MSRSRTTALITAWLLAIPIAIMLLDRPAARFAHDVIGRHDILRWLTLPIEYVVPLGLVLLAVLGLAALRSPLPGLPHILLLACLSLTIADAIGDG